LRPTTRNQWEGAVRRLDQRLGERCWVGDVVGTIQSLHTHAMARFNELQEKGKRQRISLFATRPNKAELLPPRDDATAEADSSADFRD